MNSPDLMTAAIELVLLGMGAVFVFLVLLVWTTSLMSRVLARIAPVVPAPAMVTHESAAEDAKLRAGMAAAIHAHRSRR